MPIRVPARADSTWGYEVRTSSVWKALIALVVTLVALQEPVAAHAEPTPIRAYIIGDSYSAGTGLGDFTGRADCDRDWGTYAWRALLKLRSDDGRRISASMAACSGATTSRMIDRQLSGLNASYNVAVLTAGGNDLNFSGRVKTCVLFGCSRDTQNLGSTPLPSWDDLFNRLVRLYTSTRMQMAPDGHLYVVTYPVAFAGQGALICEGMSLRDQGAANAFITRLDDTIWQAVQRARSDVQAQGRAGNIHFVEWRTGHVATYTSPSHQRFRAYWNSSEGLCNSQGNRPFLNGLTPTGASPSEGPTAYLGNSFHPNSTGYWYAAVQLSDSIRRYQG